MARDNSCTFTVPGLIIRLSNVRFRPTVCGSNLLTSFRQASKPAPSCRVMHNVQCLSFQKLCQCNVDFRIDFDRIGTSFDIVNVQYWCVLLSCPVKSISSTMGTTAAAMFSNLKAQSFHEAGFGVKVHQLGECSRLDECSVSSGSPVLRLNFRSHLNICSIPCSQRSNMSDN